MRLGRSQLFFRRNLQMNPSFTDILNLVVAFIDFSSFWSNNILVFSSNTSDSQWQCCKKREGKSFVHGWRSIKVNKHKWNKASDFIQIFSFLFLFVKSDSDGSTIIKQFSHHLLWLLQLLLCIYAVRILFHIFMPLCKLLVFFSSEKYRWSLLFKGYVSLSLLMRESC